MRLSYISWRRLPVEDRGFVRIVAGEDAGIVGWKFSWYVPTGRGGFQKVVGVVTQLGTVYTSSSNQIEAL